MKCLLNPKSYDLGGEVQDFWYSGTFVIGPLSAFLTPFPPCSTLAFYLQQ